VPEVWAIRIRLQLSQRIRDLALFNLALDSKLRGCDVVSLRVSDITLGWYREPPLPYFSAKLGVRSNSN